MYDTLDIQRDHLGLIKDCARLLAYGGVLWFSVNRSQFSLDERGLSKAGLYWEDLTAKTIPQDFARRPKIHRCWRITREKIAGEDGKIR
jgi:23S rRNA (guanine2445-N2)-methyltransferase / 23S rRNA (guanine2069-N7)-methyltransferase